MFRDYQINLGNTVNLNSSLQRGRYTKFLGRWENLILGYLTFYGGLNNPLKIMELTVFILYFGLYARS